ncbi:hypothetical protein NM688_g9197 [Phlebia brevispora]|uniref:Uncharacterized protein n=1 Tax=Phlebia brevispora TaxID=194682 RepID=A0ACC1RJ05_9APHY|nr:hypothetical protein NM688_g9197 [Phlebia brevispora]
MTVPPEDTHDPSTAAYKKARRQYLKSTRNKDDRIEAQWTPFRAAEKKYKAKFPPPDLSDVLDLALLDDTRSGECKLGGWSGSADALVFRAVDLEEEKGKKVYIFPSIPGLVVIPSFISPDDQRTLVRVSLRDQAKHPNETNLDTHYMLPEEGLWNAYLKARHDGTSEESIPPRAATSDDQSHYIVAEPGPRKLISNEAASKENYATIAAAPALPYAPSLNAKPMSPTTLVPKLRWANIGWYYHWGSKQYDFTRGKIEVNHAYRDVCRRAVQAVPWSQVFSQDDLTDWGDEPDWTTWRDSYGIPSYAIVLRIYDADLDTNSEPDAGIVNFYQARDTLMAHVDRSEVCATSPLVSISLGCAAVFLMGAMSRDTKPAALLLRSGDIVIMSGPHCRRAYHGVPRILENTLPAHFSSVAGDDEWIPYEEYLGTTRVNINVRQVFPKGFDPGL